MSFLVSARRICGILVLCRGFQGFFEAGQFVTNAVRCAEQGRSDESSVKAEFIADHPDRVRTHAAFGDFHGVGRNELPELEAAEVDGEVFATAEAAEKRRDAVFAEA